MRPFSSPLHVERSTLLSLLQTYSNKLHDPSAEDGVLSFNVVRVMTTSQCQTACFFWLGLECCIRNCDHSPLFLQLPELDSNDIP